MVARDGVERFSAPCNQQVADYTMDTKDKGDSKDIRCMRFVCGFRPRIRFQIRRPALWSQDTRFGLHNSAAILLPAQGSLTGSLVPR